MAIFNSYVFRIAPGRLPREFPCQIHIVFLGLQLPYSKKDALRR